MSVSWSVSCQYHVGVMVSIIVSIIVSIMSVSWSVSLWLVSWSLSLSISWSVSCQYYVNFMVCIMVRWAMHYLLVHSIRYSVTHVPWSVSRRYPGRYHDSIMFSIMVSSILFIVMTVSWSVVFYLFIYGSIVAVSWQYGQYLGQYHGSIMQERKVTCLSVCLSHYQQDHKKIPDWFAQNIGGGVQHWHILI